MIVRPTKKTFFEYTADGFLYGAFVSFLIVATLIFLNRPARLHINSINVSGAYYVSASDIESSIDQSLKARNCLRIASCAHALFIPKRQLKKELSTKFPRLETINFDISGTALTVSVAERSHVALVCLTDKSQCWFIDALGIAFAPSPLFSDGVYTTFIIPKVITVPNQVLPSWSYGAVTEFANYAHIHITTIEATKKSITLWFDKLENYSFSQPSHIMLKPIDLKLPDSRVYMGQVFYRLISSEKVATQLAANRTPEYFDLRFKGKVFYKFR